MNVHAVFSNKIEVISVASDEFYWIQMRATKTRNGLNFGRRVLYEYEITRKMAEL